MSDHYRILGLIRSIREAHPIMTTVYSYGSCWNLFKTLRFAFPEARAYYSQIEGHVITRIGEKYYDITGEVSADQYSPIVGLFGKDRASRVIKQMDQCVPCIIPINKYSNEDSNSRSCLSD